MTNTWQARASSNPPCAGRGWRAALGLTLPLLLAGCINDASSYLIEGSPEHSITLKRTQNWFWQDSLELAVVVSRLPECQGGATIEQVPIAARPELYQAPPGYPEPIYILKVGQRHYAIGTLSCQVQKFQEAPDDLGTRLGVFEERAGKFGFHPD
jgi:hypothetical protein